MRSLVVLLSAALAVPSVALGAEPVAVDIETSNLEGEGPTLVKQLGKRLEGAFGEEGWTVDPTTDERRVHVRIRRNEVFGYEVEIRIEVGEETVEPEVASFTCDPCRVLDLYDRVEGTVPGIVEAIRKHEAPPPAEPAAGGPTDEAKAEEDPADDEPRHVSDVDEPPRARVLGGVGFGGIAVATVGFGTMIGGSVLLSRAETTEIDGSDERFLRRETYKRPGWTWAGVGLGVLAVGVTMLAVDLTVLRQRRARRVKASAALSPHFTGASLHVEF